MRWVKWRAEEDIWRGVIFTEKHWKYPVERAVLR